MLAYLDSLCAALLARNTEEIRRLLAHPMAQDLPRRVREEAVAISRLPGATDVAMTPDGQRVLVQMPEDGAHANELHVIVNWRSELK